MIGPLRWLLFVAVTIGLFVAAINGDVYTATSPPDFSGHVLLRKVYSIVAFAVVGGTYAFARRDVRVMDGAIAIALYSGAIEIGQWFVTDEGLRWNVADVACGGIGGALGTYAERARRRLVRRR